MLMSLELDTDKFQNTSLVRAYFTETKSSLLFQNFTFKHNQKKCFKQSIFIKVIASFYRLIIAWFGFFLPDFDHVLTMN